MFFKGRIFPRNSPLIITFMIIIETSWLISAIPETLLDEPNESERNGDELISMQLNQLQLKSEQQEREISFLGNRVEKQEDEMKHMKRNYSKVFQLLAIQSFKKSALFEESSGLFKPDVWSPAFQLLPTEESRVPRSLPVVQNTKNVVRAKLITEKWPSNCKDLHSLGYTLSGLYMVKDVPTEPTKIQAVYCTFKNSNPNFPMTYATSTTVSEERVGFLDIKSHQRGVHFYVERDPKLPPRTPGGVLQFKLVRLNLGGGMNVSTGVFTAPTSGIYHFDFFTLKNGLIFEPFKMNLRHNGLTVGTSNNAPGLWVYTVVIRSTLKLKRGDKVDIFHDKGAYAEADFMSTHFSGSLLEEDIF